VEFGSGCYVQGGFGGWWTAVAGPSSTPVGWLDSADAGNNGRIQGWALDAAAASTSIDVHVYIDIGTSQVRGYAVATNVSRPDVNAAYGVSGNHGFDFAIPPELLDGTQHRVDVFAIDPHGAGYPLLSGCPKYFARLPQAATLVSPAGNTYEATPVFVWNAGANAASYWVQVDDVSDPGVAVGVYKGLFNAANVCSGGRCAIAPGKGLPASVYRWNVESQNAAGKTWATARTFNVLPPSGPGLVSPSGATTNPTPAFTWNASAGATRYWLAVLDQGGNVAWQGDFYPSGCSGSICSGAPPHARG